MERQDDARGNNNVAQVEVHREAEHWKREAQPSQSRARRLSAGPARKIFLARLMRHRSPARVTAKPRDDLVVRTTLPRLAAPRRTRLSPLTDIRQYAEWRAGR